MILDESGQLEEKEVLDKKKIIMYGASTRNIAAIEELGIEENVLFFVDSNEKKDGTMLGGYEIHKAEVLSEYKDCLIVSVLIEHAKNVLKSVEKTGHTRCLFYLPEHFDIHSVIQNNKNVVENSMASYKYVHIIPNSIFFKIFYTMVKEQFYFNDHFFIYLCINKDDKTGMMEYALEQSENNKNILIYDDINEIYNFVSDENMKCNKAFETDIVKKILDSADKILLHSAFWGKNAQKWIGEMTKKHNNKMTWFCWGDDSLFDVNSYIVNGILRKISYSYASQSRISLIEREYKIPIKPTKASYCYIMHNEINDTIEDKGDGTTRILLGHSAIEEDNHEYGLRMLYKYRNENIKIYCPLSYGYDEYKDRIIKKGNSMFGEKFVPLTDFMEINQYYTFLNSIDVAVFPISRKLAGTTIIYLNAIGKKIYMNKEMIDCFADAEIHAEDIMKIETQTFSEFVEHRNGTIKSDESIKKLNRNIVTEWEKILNDEGE